MDAASVIDTLTPLVAGATFEAAASVDFATIYVPADRLVETCRALRDTPAFRFDLLIEVTAVDFLPRTPRYEVVYHLVSIPNRLRLRLKVPVPDGGSVPTVQSVWPASGWAEREVWDMFGIFIDGHQDLRRILMPEDWEGHPQRKDYPVQIRKTAQTYEPLEVSEQEFRANMERDRARRVGSSEGVPALTGSSGRSRS
jgi:NADH-quinone oxidoreductase subunit C